MAEVTYVTIYNSHSGALVKIPRPVRFSGLARLKDHLCEQFPEAAGCSVDDVVLLTPFGIRMEFGSINETPEVFFYDRRLFRPGGAALERRYTSEPEPARPGPPKQALAAATTSANPSKDAEARLRSLDVWAGHVARSARRSGLLAAQVVAQLNAMFKLLNIMFQFAGNFVRAAEKQLQAQLGDARGLAGKSLAGNWKAHWAALKAMPPFELPSGRWRLADLVSEPRMAAAAAFVAEHLPALVAQHNDVAEALNRVLAGRADVDTRLNELRRQSADRFKDRGADLGLALFEQRWAHFAEAMLHLPTTSVDSLPAVLEGQLAALESLYAAASAIWQYEADLRSFKATLVAGLRAVYEQIAALQLDCVQLRARCKALAGDKDKTTEAAAEHVSLAQLKAKEEVLAVCLDLPLLFGLVLIEKRRRFEWHDFYARGIVTGVSEQLTVLIESERRFQKLWLRRFGRHLRSAAAPPVSVHVPAIDVTVVNAGGPLQAALAWLDTGTVQRGDIAAYIAQIQAAPHASADRDLALLERTFKDLVVSTDRLKLVTRVVASLSTYSALASGFHGPGKELDAELNVIHGLRARIKKLEDLLHQQQYKNLGNWEQPHRSVGLLQKNETNKDQDATLRLEHAQLLASVQQLQLEKAALQLTYEKLVSDHESLSDKKHQLDDEVEAMRTQIAEKNTSLERDKAEHATALAEQKAAFDAQLAELAASHERERADAEAARCDNEAELAELRALAEAQREELERALAQAKQAKEAAEAAEAAGRASAKSSADLSLKVQALEARVSAVDSEKEQLRAEKEQLCQTENTTEAEHTAAELQSVNADLMANLQAKDDEFHAERLGLEKKLAETTCKYEEKAADYEDLMEVMQTKLHAADELLERVNLSLRALLAGMHGLLVRNLEFFAQFCLVLEAMGLLLVRGPNENGVQEYRIRRVKGLRSKTADQMQLQSTAAQDVAKEIEWILALEKQTGGSTDVGEADALEEQTRLLLEVCELYVLEKGGLSKLREFLRFISFQENVQLQASEKGQPPGEEHFFFNGIKKRFNDLEGFAKRLSKENKAKTLELSQRISVRDFHVGDLALFLPTRIENGTETPWTAFTMDGPHYFLDISGHEDAIAKGWVVGRIVDITEHDLAQHNPHQLEGKWFEIRAQGT